MLLLLSLLGLGLTSVLSRPVVAVVGGVAVLIEQMSEPHSILNSHMNDVVSDKLNEPYWKSRMQRVGSTGICVCGEVENKLKQCDWEQSKQRLNARFDGQNRQFSEFNA